MRQRIILTAFTAIVAATVALTAAGLQTQKPTVDIPKPGVPQIMTIEGNFIRVAYNNEGYAIIGYRVANNSIGEEWMLLELGATMRQGKPAYNMPRSALSLTTPDNNKIPLATNEEYLQVNLMALQNRAKVMHDSIDYFPPTVTRGGRIGFFSDLGTRTRSVRSGRAQPASGQRGPRVLQDPWRDQVRTALAERAVERESGARSVSNPDRRGRETADEELQGHPETGAGGLQPEEELRAGPGVTSVPSRRCSSSTASRRGTGARCCLWRAAASCGPSSSPSSRC